MVRLGILGCARIALTGIIEPARIIKELEVLAVASRDPVKGKLFSKEHGIAKFYGSYEELIADPEIDVIYNPLPNSLHAEWSIRAMMAGKGVLCEKPFASNAQEARRMADCARLTGRPLMEAVHYRFHPLAHYIDELISSKRLGHIEYIEAGLEVAEEFIPPDDIRFQRDLAGGAMMDLGTYCIGALRWISGQEPTTIDAVAQLSGPDVDRAMQAQCVFPSGIQAAFQCSFSAPQIKGWLRVRGTKGNLHVDNPFHPQLGNSVRIETEAGISELTFDPTPTYVFQALSFAQLWHGGVPVISLEDSVANMEAIDATYRAAGLLPR